MHFHILSTLSLSVSMFESKRHIFVTWACSEKVSVRVIGW